MWWFEEPVSNFQGFNLSELNTDEAFLNISSSYGKPLWMYILSEDCHTCPFQKLLNEPILQNHSYKASVTTQHGFTFRLRMSGESNFTPNANDSFRICDLRAKLGEFGVYSILVQNDLQELTKCSIKCDLEPVNTFLPILTTLLLWICVSIILKYVLKHTCVHACFIKLMQKISSLYTTIHQRQETTPILDQNSDIQVLSETEAIDTSQENENTSRKIKTRRRKKRLTSHSQTQKTPTADNDKTTVLPSTSSRTVIVDESIKGPSISDKERLKSLDAFRGLCIIIMIFADDGGGGYYFFQHCTWDGLYVADVAFPWFLWICGASIPFSMLSKISSATSKTKIFIEVLKRSLKLICLGIVVNTSTKATAVQLENLRFPGVLQRFGICYFIGSTLLLLFFNPIQINVTNEASHRNGHDNRNWKFHFKDFNYTLIPWCIVLICIGIHTGLIFLLPVPGCPTGYLGPAGLHNDSAFSPNCVGGAAGYIDRLIFGTDYIHKWPTSKKVYGSGAFDPEGSLGILTSVLHIWLGIQAGIIFLTYKDIKSRLIRLLFWSTICGCVGYILCGGISNSGWIPVNKNLWSLSFVLVTSSTALALVAALYLVIDVYSKWHGSPLVEAGRNSIFLYLAHEVCHAMLPWHFSYGRMRLHANKLLETTWGTFLWISVAVYLHNKQLFFVI